MSTEFEAPERSRLTYCAKGPDLGRKFISSLVLSAILSGCTAAVGTEDTDPDIISEQVAVLAAPYQDVSTARLLPRDGCYWYLHQGPVETTLLPLRTIDGRPICAARE